MFIVPETAPECRRPMSMHKAQDGARVISAPKIAIERKRTAVRGRSM